MKKYLALLTFLPIIFFIASCTDSTTDPETPATGYGTFYLQTTPTYAQFFVDSDTQFKISNEDTVKNLTAGTHTIVVKYDNYKDTTFTVTISANKLTTSTISLSPATVLYGPITIYETSGTTALQPSGLILSTGTATSSSNSAIDLLYFSNSASSIYELRSSDLITSTLRKTRFKASGTKNINDGIAAPAYDPATWTSFIQDRDTSQYYYVYDNDSHYAKVKVVSFGDVSGKEVFVNVQVLYNKAAGEKRFK